MQEFYDTCFKLKQGSGSATVCCVRCASSALHRNAQPVHRARGAPDWRPVVVYVAALAVCFRCSVFAALSAAYSLATGHWPLLRCVRVCVRRVALQRDPTV